MSYMKNLFFLVNELCEELFSIVWKLFQDIMENYAIIYNNKLVSYWNNWSSNYLQTSPICKNQTNNLALF